MSSNFRGLIFDTEISKNRFKMPRKSHEKPGLSDRNKKPIVV